MGEWTLGGQGLTVTALEECRADRERTLEGESKVRKNWEFIGNFLPSL